MCQTHMDYDKKAIDGENILQLLNFRYIQFGWQILTTIQCPVFIFRCKGRASRWTYRDIWIGLYKAISESEPILSSIQSVKVSVDC